MQEVYTMGHSNRSAVPERAKQEREIEAMRAWVEPSVWTQRMLEALVTGVKGGLWFSLIDKVYNRKNLESAAHRVLAKKGAPGVDHVTTSAYRARYDEEITQLAAYLQAERYQPQAIRRVYIEKVGSKVRRPLGIPTIRDRVLQRALLHVLEPIFEQRFSDRSYGYRPGRSAKDALREVDRYLRQGYDYVVEVDIKSYFETIDHSLLLAKIEEEVADRRVLGLIEALLCQAIQGTSSEQGKGVAQGAVTSPLWGNIYLTGVDHQMASLGYVMIRYADDALVLCRSEAEAQEALAHLRQSLVALKLSIQEEKTRLVHVAGAKSGTNFLGYHFYRTQKGTLRRRPRRKSIAHFKAKVRRQTSRLRGDSLAMILAQLNPLLRGWSEYFKQSRRKELAELVVRQTKIDG
jgi:RNA-directed DNA polymerase